MSRNQRDRPKDVTNPHRDLPLQARLALVDYLAELRRQSKGVRPMSKRLPNDPLTPLFQPAGAADTGAKPKAVVPRLGDTRKLGPAKAYLNSLGIGAKSLAEVARELGVSVNTLRKLMNNPELDAPSYIADWGGRQIYVYTPDDVAELKAYFTKQRTVGGLRKRKEKP